MSRGSPAAPRSTKNCWRPSSFHCTSVPRARTAQPACAPYSLHDLEAVIALGVMAVGRDALPVAVIAAGCERLHVRFQRFPVDHALAGAGVDLHHGLGRELSLAVDILNAGIDRAGFVAVAAMVETGIQRYLDQQQRVVLGVWMSFVLFVGFVFFVVVLLCFCCGLCLCIVAFWVFFV